MRVCEPCLDSILTTYGSNWTQADTEADVNDNTVCSSCEKEIEVEEPHALFATVYRRGQEREDWFGLYCRECALGLVDALKLE
jgi:hypothetical protein